MSEQASLTVAGSASPESALPNSNPPSRTRSGKDRTRPCTAVYRVIVATLEARRIELGLTMERVNDLTGLQDGYYARMLNPDSKYGRQATWESIDMVFEVLFGKRYQMHVAAENYRMPSKLETRAHPSAKPVQGLHWRYRNLFRDLGRRGAKATNSRSREQRSASAKKAAETRRLKRMSRSADQKAASNGEAHGGRVPCVGGDQLHAAMCPESRG